LRAPLRAACVMRTLATAMEASAAVASNAI
jgi:hypothetical protein